MLNNEVLPFCDDSPRYIYFPETAVISESQLLEDGRSVETSMIGKESALGIPSIFSDDLRVNWTQVIIPGTALRIRLEVLREIVAADGALQKTFFSHLNSYIRQLTQRAVCHNYHSIEERFCSWLLMLDRKNSDGGLTLTQEKIARLLGVHRPSITNIALNLRDQKLISYLRGRIYILNRKHLESYACSCHLI